MTVFAYYRVSTDKQDYNSQKIGVVDYCRRNDLIVDKEIIDDGVSGTIKAKDRNLWKIVKSAKKGDWVISSELSRFGRSTADVLNTCQILSKKGVNVYFCKQNMILDNSPMGKLLVAIMSAFSELERDLISQRTKESMKRLKNEGKKIGRIKGSKNKKSKADMKKETIIDLYNKGMSFKKISIKVNLSYPTIKKSLTKWGVYNETL